MKHLAAGIRTDSSDLDDEKQILGKQIWRVLPYVKRYWKRAAGGIATNGMARAFDLIPFVAIGMAADYYKDGIFTDSRVESLLSWNPELGFGLLIFLSFAGLAINQGISEFLWQSTAYKVQHDIRMEATSKLMAMEASYFEIRQSGNLMSVLSADVAQLEDIVSDASTSIIRLVITFSVAFIILMWMSPTLALVLFVPLLLILPMVVWFSTRVQRRYRNQRESTGGIVSILENVLSGMSVVQAYNATDHERARVSRESAHYRDEAISASILRNRFLPGLFLVAGLSFGLLVSAGGWLIAKDEITIGQFVTFLLISTRMTMPMFIVGILLNQLQRGEAAAKRVFSLIDLEPSIADADDAVALDGRIDSIEFKGVTFTYPGTDTTVLNDVSFVQSGSGFTGIMGHTGAGKSTILKLLERFYEPQQGSVLINGENINSYTIASVRDRVGFVSQEPFLFFGSIRENVAYAREASDEQVNHALDMAGATEFVDALSEGVDTLVGDRGVRLSGGQRARISLARALLMDPDVLILDEASAALDAETEKRIQESLFDGGGNGSGKNSDGGGSDGGDEGGEKAGRITIAVAHRLATIRKADEILSLVDGVIVERGQHNELLQNDNVYASQWSIQTGQLDRSEES
jgi:ATP-binding cassette subfamily B protein